MKKIRTALLFGLLSGLLPHYLHAQTKTGFSEEPAVQAFIVDMHEQHGFDITHLTQQFAAIQPNASVLRFIRPPAVPSKQRSWQRYRQRFVNGRRQAGGQSLSLIHI